MKIGVIGLRDLSVDRAFEDSDLIERVLSEQFAHCLNDNGVYANLSLITGGSKGTERFCEQWARKNMVVYERVSPDLTKIPENGSKQERRSAKDAAFTLRNRTIVDQSDRMLFFWRMERGPIEVALRYAKERHKTITVSIM